MELAIALPLATRTVILLRPDVFPDVEDLLSLEESEGREDDGRDLSL